MRIPDTYYDQLREKLKSAKISVKEDLDVVIIHHWSLCLHLDESRSILLAPGTLHTCRLRR